MMSVVESVRHLVSAWKFMWATPKRRLFVLAPVLLNLLLWVGLIPAAFFFTRFVIAMPLPDAWWATIVSLLAGVVAVMATVMVAVFVFVALTAVLGAPFYGALAEEALREAGVPFAEQSWFIEMVRAFSLVVKVGVLFVGLQGLLVGLNVIPVVGTILHVLGGFVVALFLLALEFFGEAFAKASMSLRQQIRFLIRYKKEVFLFILPVFFLLFIPGVNLFVPPLAVVAASQRYAIIIRV